MFSLGLFEAPQDSYGFITNVAILWLFVGVGALLFRTVHLFFLMGVQSCLVWFSRILTAPFHDMKIYHKSLYHLMKAGINTLLLMNTFRRLT